MDAVGHGERRRYGAGCRCAACTQANTEYQRHYRERTMPTLHYTAGNVRVVQPPLPFGR
jgi:hypothetical protein